MHLGTDTTAFQVPNTRQRKDNLKNQLVGRPDPLQHDYSTSVQNPRACRLLQLLDAGVTLDPRNNLPDNDPLFEYVNRHIGSP